MSHPFLIIYLFGLEIWIRNSKDLFSLFFSYNYSFLQFFAILNNFKSSKYVIFYGFGACSILLGATVEQPKLLFLRFFYRKIREKSDKYFIISNQRFLAKKIDNNKRIRQFVHFKVYFNRLIEFWKNIEI